MFRSYKLNLQFAVSLLFAFVIFAYSNLAFATNLLEVKVNKNSVSTQNNTVNVDLDIVQTGEEVVTPLNYSFMLTDPDGRLIHQTDLKELSFDTFTKQTSLKISIEFPTNVSAKDGNLFMVLENPKGLMLYSSYLGNITIEPQNTDSQEEPVNINLKNCRLNYNDKYLEIACEYHSETDKNLEVVSEIYANSGEMVASANTLISNQEAGKFNVQIPINVKPGKYKTIIYLQDKDAVYNSNKLIKYLLVDGDWVSIVHHSVPKLVNNVFSSTVLFDGSANSTKPRGFYWWVIDEKQNPCESGHIDLEHMPPFQYNISTAVDNSCVAPSFVGFLYNGFESKNVPIIIDTIGDADFVKLYSESSFTNSVNNTDNISYSKALLVLALIALGIILIVILMKLDRKISSKMVAIVLLTSGAFALVSASVSSYGTSTTTWDNPNVLVSLEFNQNAFAPNSNLLFTFSLNDRRGAADRPIADAYAKIDNGRYAKIINASSLNAGDFYVNQISSLKAPAQIGSHKLYIKIPALCGSAFDYSLFDKARFGTQDCVFEFDFDVRKDIATCDTPPCDATPTISTLVSDPVVNGACTSDGRQMRMEFISFYATDHGQGRVAYEIALDDGRRFRIPTRGFVAAGTKQSLSVALQGKTSLTGQIRAVTSDGNYSDLVPLNLVCGTQTSCGNGLLEITLGEQCDDGNLRNGDGCSSSCQNESGRPNCGNGIWEPRLGEQCDGAQVPAGQTCTPHCLLQSACAKDLTVKPSKALVRKGGQLRLEISPPSVPVEKCELYANNIKILDMIKAPRALTIPSFEGETDYTLRCMACGTTVSTTTKVRMTPGWIER